MNPSTVARGGCALPLKPDSLRTVAISTGTGTPYLRSVCSAAVRQLPTKPSRWSNTAQTLLIWLGGVAQEASASRARIGTIRLKLYADMAAALSAIHKG